MLVREDGKGLYCGALFEVEVQIGREKRGNGAEAGEEEEEEKEEG